MQGGGVGEDPDDLGASLDLAVEAFEGLVDQILGQCASGKSANAVISSRASRSIVATSGSLGSSMVATTSTCSRTRGPVGWAKIVRIVVATIAEEALGTRVSTLRMKWTRQRCQVAPAITWSIAAIRPRWWSEITSCTPARPRSRSPRRKSVQNALDSLSPTADPSTSRRPSADTPVAITTAWDTTRPFRRALQ